MSDTETQPSTDPAERRDAARRALLQGLHVRASARRVREAYPPDSDEWCMATPLVVALDGAVRRQVEAARTAGIGSTELGRIVGISRQRIDYMVNRERAIIAAAEAAYEDGAGQRTRDAAVAELRAAEAERVAVRATPSVTKRAAPVRYHTRRRAAQMRLCRAIIAAHAEGLTLAELAAVSGLAASTVRRILMATS